MLSGSGQTLTYSWAELCQMIIRKQPHRSWFSPWWSFFRLHWHRFNTDGTESGFLEKREPAGLGRVRQSFCLVFLYKPLHQLRAASPLSASEERACGPAGQSYGDLMKHDSCLPSKVWTWKKSLKIHLIFETVYGRPQIKETGVRESLFSLLRP